MSLSTDFFGGGGSGLFPAFVPDGAAPVNFNNTVSDIAIPAFNSYDGGHVDYPKSSTGNLIHVDKTDTPVWTYAPTAVYTGHTNFFGGRYDAVDDLFWIATLDTGTDTVGLSTINAAGTVVNKGTSVAGATPSADGICALRRTIDGTGNLIVNLLYGEIELNFTTGVIVTQEVFTGSTRPVYGDLKLADGLYVAPTGMVDADSGYSAAFTFSLQEVDGPITAFRESPIRVLTFEANDKGLPVMSGKPVAPRWQIMESGTHFLLTHDTAAIATNILTPGFWYDKETFLIAINTMAKNYGLI